MPVVVTNGCQIKEMVTNFFISQFNAQNAEALIGIRRRLRMIQSQDSQVKFNAGVDTAMYINYLLKLAGHYARINDYPNWHKTLKELHRWVSPKLKKKEYREELENKSKSNISVLSTYQKKISKNKKIPANTLHKLFNYLSDYEIELRKYIDKFGMQMPDSEDPRFAL